MALTAPLIDVPCGLQPPGQLPQPADGPDGGVIVVPGDGGGDGEPNEPDDVPPTFPVVPPFGGPVDPGKPYIPYGADNPYPDTIPGLTAGEIPVSGTLEDLVVEILQAPDGFELGVQRVLVPEDPETKIGVIGVEILWTPTVQNIGINTITLLGTNIVDSQDFPFSVTVQAPPVVVPPGTTIDFNTIAETGSPYLINATNQSNPTNTFSVDAGTAIQVGLSIIAENLSNGATFSPGEFTFFPNPGTLEEISNGIIAIWTPQTAGLYEFELAIFDNNNQNNQSIYNFSVDVMDPPPPTAISPTHPTNVPTTAIIGEPFLINGGVNTLYVPGPPNVTQPVSGGGLAIFDPNGTNPSLDITFQVTNSLFPGGFGDTNNTNQINVIWTPTQLGTYSIVMTLTNEGVGGGLITAQFFVDVISSPGNLSPITSPNTQTNFFEGLDPQDQSENDYHYGGVDFFNVSPTILATAIYQKFVTEYASVLSPGATSLEQIFPGVLSDQFKANFLGGLDLDTYFITALNNSTGLLFTDLFKDCFIVQVPSLGVPGLPVGQRVSRINEVEIQDGPPGFQLVQPLTFFDFPSVIKKGTPPGFAKDNFLAFLKQTKNNTTIDINPNVLLVYLTIINGFVPTAVISNLLEILYSNIIPYLIPIVPFDLITFPLLNISKLSVLPKFSVLDLDNLVLTKVVWKGIDILNALGGSINPVNFDISFKFSENILDPGITNSITQNYILTVTPISTEFSIGSDGEVRDDEGNIIDFSAFKPQLRLKSTTSTRTTQAASIAPIVTRTFKSITAPPHIIGRPGKPKIVEEISTEVVNPLPVPIIGEPDNPRGGSRFFYRNPFEATIKAPKTIFSPVPNRTNIPWFRNFVHVNIDTTINKQSGDIASKIFRFRDMSDEHIRRSLKPEMRAIITGIQGIDGDPISYRQFTEAIRRSIADGTINRFDIAYFRELFKQFPRKRAKIRIPVKPLPRSGFGTKSRTQLSRERDIRVIGSSRDPAKPISRNVTQGVKKALGNKVSLDPNFYSTQMREIVKLWHILPPDINAKVCIFTDEDEQINVADVKNDRTFDVFDSFGVPISTQTTSFDSLPVTQDNGDIVLVDLCTERNRAVVLNNADQASVLKSLNIPDKIELEVTSDPDDDAEFTDDLSADLKKSYILELDGATVTDLPHQNIYVRRFSANYKFTDSSESHYTDIAKYDAYPWLALYIDYDDAIFSHFKTTSTYKFTFNNFSTHKFLTNDNDSIFVRKIPLLIAVIPNDTTQGNIFKGTSVITDFNVRKIEFVQSPDTSLNKIGMLKHYLRPNFSFPQTDVKGNINTEGLDFSFSFDSPLLQRGISRSLSERLPRRGSSVRKIFETVNNLKTVYALDSRGITWTDVMSRLERKFLFTQNIGVNPELRDRLANGEKTGVKILNTKKGAPSSGLIGLKAGQNPIRETNA